MWFFKGLLSLVKSLDIHHVHFHEVEITCFDNLKKSLMKVSLHHIAQWSLCGCRPKSEVLKMLSFPHFMKLE